MNPAFIPTTINDLAFDGFDRDGGVIDVERATRFTRGRADAAREFWEVIGGMEHVKRVLPIALIDEIVPIRDDIVHWAAVVTIRNPAIHAA